MEEAAEQQLPLRDLRQGKGENVVKRKLVQSVMFSQIEKDEANPVLDNDEKDEDWCNSSKKRQKKPPKGKTNSNSKVGSQSRTPKKVDFYFIFLNFWELFKFLLHELIFGKGFWYCMGMNEEILNCSIFNTGSFVLPRICLTL